MGDPEDKILSYRLSDGEESRVYSMYRIDYDDSRSLREIMGLDDTDDLQSQFSGTIKPVSQTAVDRGYHSVKQGFQGKVLVADGTVRNEVHSILDGEGINYVTEDVQPTQDEKDAIRAFGATSDTDIPDAMDWKQAVEDLEKGRISRQDFELGRNPNRNKDFDKPGNR